MTHSQSDIVNHKGLILAAGRGSRMGHLSAFSPKCMVKIGGKKLIAWQLEAMNQTDVDEITVVTGYMHHEFERLPVKKIYNKNWQASNMVRSLLCAESVLASHDTVVSYADIFYESAAIECLLKETSDIAILYHTKWREIWEGRFGDPLLDAETFKVDKNGFVVEIGNRAQSVEQIEGQYLGLLKFTPQGWSMFRDFIMTFDDPFVDKMDMTQALKLLVAQRGSCVKGVPFTGVWGEIDSEFDLNFFRRNYD